MPVVKHGDVVVLKAASEQRLRSSPNLALMPQAFVVIEDEETNTLSLERVPFKVIAALAPHVHRAALDELYRARQTAPIASAKD